MDSQPFVLNRKSRVVALATAAAIAAVFAVATRLTPDEKGYGTQYEVLSVNREIRELINQDPNVERLRELHRSSGGTNLMEEGIRMAEDGQTSLEEAARVAFTE